MGEDKLIRDISEICFRKDISIPRHELHTSLLNEISKYLKNQGFRVEFEYPLKFIQKDKLRQGYVDLYATNENLDICLEFDTGTHLKYKSIQKILRSKANFCIGIVKGKPQKTSPFCKLFNENKERLNKTIKMFEFCNLDKLFYVIIISEKKFESLKV